MRKCSAHSDGNHVAHESQYATVSKLAPPPLTLFQNDALNSSSAGSAGTQRNG